MKKFIIIALTVIIAIVSAISLMSYFSSFKKVSITLADDVDSITIFSDGDNKENVGTLSSSGEISLRQGSYYIEPTGDKISNSSIDFSIYDNDIEINIDPDYSRKHLTDLLNVDKDNIEDIIKNDIKGTKSYSIEKQALYKKGAWYGALLVRPNSTSSAIDRRNPYIYYRVILHKVDGEWKPIDMPRLVFTSHDYKDVPVDVLREVNRLKP